MSRVGNSPVPIPNGVTVEKTENLLVVNGSKGKLEISIHPKITVDIEGSQINVKRKNEERDVKALHGLTRNLIANMVKGVSEGWSKNLELVGVGFRAQGGGNKLTLSVGYSHPVSVDAPEGIAFEVADNTKIKVSGIDKYLVGQVAANIKAVRPPDVYKGKGIRYAGEYIRRKAGKAGKVGAAAGAK
ncbi:50S ribosomal protein L6 [Candidatus Daviesbacteria bacterium]|nr:50S ribosomal protein L6 [Candidatus Daviesbacteria bacterium]